MIGAQRSRLRLRDLVAEASAGLLQRPLRSALTMLGTVLGIASVVAILGLTSTARGQISDEFSVLSATQVTVTDHAAEQGQSVRRMSFPDDAADRIERLRGAQHAGLYWRVRTGGAAVTATPRVSDGGADTAVTMFAADPGALAVAGARASRGRLYDAFAAERAEPVAVLGSAAARALGIGRLDTEPAVFVGEQAFTVVGVVDSTRRHPELLSGVMIPAQTAVRTFGVPSSPPAQMLIDTQVGAAPLIARQAALALRPDAPQRFSVAEPAEPELVRGAVGEQMNLLFLLLAGISLTIGAFGIANTTLVAVNERIPEIGLRRALGGRRRHIVAQFLTESTTLGTLGGLIGTSIGVGVVLGVAVANEWTAILQPWAVLPAPLLGSVIGLLAGLYPSLRAAWVEPISALRR